MWLNLVPSIVKPWYAVIEIISTYSCCSLMWGDRTRKLVLCTESNVRLRFLHCASVALLLYRYMSFRATALAKVELRQR